MQSPAHSTNSTRIRRHLLVHRQRQQLFVLVLFLYEAFLGHLQQEFRWHCPCQCLQGCSGRPESSNHTGPHISMQPAFFCTVHLMLLCNPQSHVPHMHSVLVCTYTVYPILLYTCASVHFTLMCTLCILCICAAYAHESHQNESLDAGEFISYIHFKSLKKKPVEMERWLRG